MLPNLLLINYNYNFNEIFVYNEYILHKVENIFQRSLLHYQLKVSPFLKTFYIGRLKLYAQASVLLCFSKWWSAKRPLQSASFWGPKDGSWRVINRYRREEEEEQIYSAELYG
jgi:hypothetical protein